MKIKEIKNKYGGVLLMMVLINNLHNLHRLFITINIISLLNFDLTICMLKCNVSGTRLGYLIIQKCVVMINSINNNVISKSRALTFKVYGKVTPYHITWLFFYVPKPY